MHRIRLLIITAIAILTAAGLASISAQQRLSPIPTSQPLSGTYVMEVAANELSLGDTEYAMGETYGWTCYGTSSGDLNGFVFISMNYTVPEYQAPPIGDQIGVSPPQPLISMSKITGGSWTKLIFLRAVYLGSVHGRIGGGTIYWSTTNLSAKISMELMADGGTGSYVGSVGKGTFEGLLDHSAKGENISGVLTLSY